jgi:hypothetical protein
VDKNAVTIVLLAGLVVAGTAVGMVYVETKRAPETRVRPERPERQVERTQVQAAAIEQQVLIERAALEASRNREADQPDCFDSDATYGADAVYVPGSTRMGGGERFDHCRLGQLVEFSCIENPAGSGRFFPEAKLIDCPSGSSCETGACVR